MEFLPALPAEIISLVTTEADPPRSALLPPQSSALTDAEITLSGLPPLSFATLLPRLEPVASLGSGLPSDGRSLPPPVAETSSSALGLRVNLPASPASPASLSSGPLVLLSSDLASGFVEELQPVRPPISELAAPLEEAVPLRKLPPPQTPDMLAARAPPPSSSLIPPPSGKSSATLRTAPSAASPALKPPVEGSLRVSVPPQSPIVRVDQQAVLDGSRAEDAAVPESRGALRIVSSSLVAESATPVSINPQPAPIAQASEAAVSARGPSMPAVVDTSATGWNQALAGRVQWMVDQEQGSARIKLNPPELGTLDIEIAMSNEKAFVKLVAVESGARELLEAALPRLRDLLVSSGLELGSANVSDGSRESAGTRPSREPVAQPEPDASADPEPEVDTARSPGGIDLYA